MKKLLIVLLLIGLTGCSLYKDKELSQQQDNNKTQLNKNESILEVIDPNENGVGRDTIGYALLELALDKSGVDYRLMLSEDLMNDERTRQGLLDGSISISDFGTNQNFEETYKAIYIPVDMGLNGWRVSLIHKDMQFAFQNVKTIDDLNQYIAGAGPGWADNDILRHSGIEVIEAPGLESLFEMLDAKRFDFFPLGANEVNHLYDTYQAHAPNAMIEEQVIIVYPFARLFFVNKDNDYLYNIVKEGLELAIEDGSFYDVFLNHPSNEAVFNELNLSKRRIIELENPYMTEAFNNIPSEYFFDLGYLN